jgi:hypothetical protein
VIELSPGSSLRPRVLACTAAAALACAVALTLPHSASAASVVCAGGTTLGTGKGPDQLIDYKFRCTEDIKAFSIVTNTSVDSFSTEVLVLDPNQQTVGGQSFGCEGDIPAWGFGCTGSGTNGAGASPPNAVSGSFTTADGPCVHPKGPERFNSWVVVSDAKGKSSQPFHLRQFKCKQAKKKRRH